MRTIMRDPVTGKYLSGVGGWTMTDNRDYAYVFNDAPEERLSIPIDGKRVDFEPVLFE